MNLQQTIRTSVKLTGIGLHSGVPASIALSPAGADTGVIFRAPDGTLIPASTDHVVDSRSATTVGAFGVRVRTIEHLMAAVSALGIDNLLVDVEGGEIPAADGSAKPFVDLLVEAGRVSLPAPRQPLAVTRPIRVGDQSRWLEVSPASEFRVTYTLDNRHPVIGLQTASVAVSEDAFAEEIAAARTYGFLKDVPMMRQHGLARGGSLDNAIVVGKRIILNESLRWSDEFVRHKILDLIGDLRLVGRPILGHVTGFNAGHTLNHELGAAIQQAAAADRRRSSGLAWIEAPKARAVGASTSLGAAR
jgi:UDP-3-O-[3-hydroxymyristoyl] N-acetylglucosamine deacetylase